MDKRFNLRVYGIWLHDGRILVNEEWIRGRKVIKLPGGGMEWGEGTIDCLKREWKEELDIDIEANGHFYTTDFFQASAYDNSQIVSIYYWITAQVPEVIRNREVNEFASWMDAGSISADTFTLPIDKKVGAMLSAHFAAGR